MSKIWGVQEKIGDVTVTVATYTREGWYGVLTYAADRIVDRWQGQYSDRVEVRGEQIKIGREHVVLLNSAKGLCIPRCSSMDHAGTSVGNGVGRTPKRKAIMVLY